MAVLNGYFDVSTYRHPTDPDWTLAIGRAEIDCENAGGGVVYFPALLPVSGVPTYYDVSGTITIAANGVQWRGVGAGASVIVNVATTVAPTVISTSPGVEFVTISDLGFTGNGIPASGLPVAPPVIAFNGGTCHKVIDCYFTDNTGETIQFAGVSDGEVCRCRFYSVGHNDGTHTSTSYRTDALVADLNCLNVRFHHNYFDTCNFGAILLSGSQCDASHNFITNAFVTSIYFNGTSTRVGFNSIYQTKAVGTVQCCGIQADGTSEFCIIGNLVSHGDGDGIAITNSWKAAVVVGNNTWANGQGGMTTIGDSGIKVATGTAASQGLIIIGNNAFDDETPAKQPYGIHVKQSGTGGSMNGSILGNNTYGNGTQAIIDSSGVLQDDSNTIIGNSSWAERQHSLAPQTTSQKVWDPPIQTMLVPAGSMRQRCGVRITAAGFTTGGTDAKSFELGFGGEGNIFSYVTPGPTYPSSATWELMAEIVNYENSATAQVAMAMFYYNGSLVGTWETPLSKDTTNSQDIYLNVKVNSSSDSITNDFFIVERC